MEGTINLIPHDDTKIRITLDMTYKETKDLLNAANKTGYWPMGKLQNILALAVEEVHTKLNMTKVTDGES